MAHDPRLSDLLPAYALGALDGEELRELERHLRGGCLECGADLARWRRQVDLLAASVPPVQPSGATRARLLALVGESPAAPVPAPDPQSPPSSARAARSRIAPWLAGLAAAAAIALLIRGGSLDAQLGALKQQTGQLGADVTRLGREGREAAGRADRAADDYRQAVEQRERALAESQRLQEGLRTAEARLHAAETQLHEAQSQVHAAEERGQRTAAELASLRSEMAQLSAQFAAVQARLLEKEDELHRARIQVASLQSNTDSRQRIVAILRQPDVYSVRLSATADGPELSAIAYVSARAQGAVLLAHLPPPPPDRDYQLWSIADGPPDSAGVIQVDPDGNAVHRVDSVRAIGSVHTWAVSVEPKGGVTRPTGRIVLAGNVS